MNQKAAFFNLLNKAVRHGLYFRLFQDACLEQRATTDSEYEKTARKTV